jgi:hypothetical protein
MFGHLSSDFCQRPAPKQDRFFLSDTTYHCAKRGFQSFDMRPNISSLTVRKAGNQDGLNLTSGFHAQKGTRLGLKNFGGGLNVAKPVTLTTYDPFRLLRVQDFAAAGFNPPRAQPVMVIASAAHRRCLRGNVLIATSCFVTAKSSGTSRSHSLQGDGGRKKLFATNLLATFDPSNSRGL